MKKYEAYKNSGIEWMEEIPEHWEIKPLKNTTDGQSSSFMDGDWIESPVIVEDGIRYLTTGNVGVINYKEQGNGYISEKTFEDLKCSEVYPGDILISRLNLPLSRCCIVPELGKRIVTAVDNVIYRPDADNYDRHYMVYLLNSARYAEYAATLGRGATMKRISRSTLGNVKLCTPSLSEQRAIAFYLDAKVGQIDESVAAINAQIDDLKAYRQSIISEAVTKGLNPNVPMKDSGVEWIGEIPEGWETPKMKWVIDLKSGSSVTSDNILDEGKFVVYGGNGPRGYINEYTNEGDFVLIGRQGALCGNINYAHGKFWATEHAVVCYPKQTMATIWLGEMLRAMNLNQYSVSAAQPGLAVERINELRIPVPPLSEQRTIASYLDTKTAKIDATIKSLEAQRDDLNALKQSVISEAVTGKIDVRDWNPNNAHQKNELI